MWFFYKYIEIDITKEILRNQVLIMGDEMGKWGKNEVKWGLRLTHISNKQYNSKSCNA